MLDRTKVLYRSLALSSMTSQQVKPPKPATSSSLTSSHLVYPRPPQSFHESMRNHRRLYSSRWASSEARQQRTLLELQNTLGPSTMDKNDCVKHSMQECHRLQADTEEEHWISFSMSLMGDSSPQLKIEQPFSPPSDHRGNLRSRGHIAEDAAKGQATSSQCEC